VSSQILSNADVAKALLGLAGRPVEALGMPLPVGGDEPKPKVKPGTRVVSSTDAELLATTAAVLSAQKPEAPAEPEAEPKAPSEYQLQKELTTKLQAELDETSRRLNALAKKRGIDLNAKDPERDAQQKLADARKAILDEAVAAAASKRDLKARRRVAKALRRAGL
jgi:hypothetical protein